jgi:hypothetical protein
MGNEILIGGIRYQELGNYQRFFALELVRQLEQHGIVAIVRGPFDDIAPYAGEIEGPVGLFVSEADFAAAREILGV